MIATAAYDPNDLAFIEERNGNFRVRVQRGDSTHRRTFPSHFDAWQHRNAYLADLGSRQVEHNPEDTSKDDLMNPLPVTEGHDLFSAINAQQARIAAPTPLDIALELQPVATPAVPEPTRVFHELPIHLPMQDVLYVSDIHAPFVCTKTLKRIIAAARKHRIKTLIIGGDLFDFDNISSHPQDGPTSGLAVCLDVAAAVLRAMGEVFDRIVLVPGNHCLRLAKKLGSAFDFSSLVYGALKDHKPNCELLISNYDYCLLGPDETGYAMGHPRWFSSTPGKTESVIAMQRRRNIISAHTHLAGVCVSPDGRFVGITPGCATRSDLTWYTARGQMLSRYADWIQGFVLIRDGRARLMTELLVNFPEEFGCD